MNFEFDPNYFLRPLASTDVGMSHSPAIEFRDNTLEGDVAVVQKTSWIPHRTTVARAFRILSYLLVRGLLLFLLAVNVVVLVAVCFGLHMGCPILQREFDA